MEVIRHLSKDELLDLQIESDEQTLSDSLEQLRTSARESAERPELFWQRQSATIHERVSETEGRRRRWIPLVWATAILLLGTGVALLNGGSAPKPGVEARPPAVALDTDQQLLIAVQQAVQSGVPDSLEPAAFLAEQIGQASQSTSSLDLNKEATSEN
jgi:hypothetical protein